MDWSGRACKNSHNNAILWSELKLKEAITYPFVAACCCRVFLVIDRDMRMMMSVTALLCVCMYVNK